MNPTQIPSDCGNYPEKGSDEEIEFNKCKNSPWYFATKYLMVNGVKYQTELPEHEFNRQFNNLLGATKIPYNE